MTELVMDLVEMTWTYNEMVRCTKFQVSTSISYKVIVNFSRKYLDTMSSVFPREIDLME